MAKSCQTSSNSGLISRYYLRYFPCLTAIYLIFITIFEMKTRPSRYSITDNLVLTISYLLGNSYFKLNTITHSTKVQVR